MARKIVLKNRHKKKLILEVILVLFVVMGVGFSLLSSDLSISGGLHVSKYVEPTLYNVFNGELVEEYDPTLEHIDSFTRPGTEKIRYFHPDTDEEVEEVLDKINVIFAGYCWKMYRTTDVGGVKMLYNGKAENNQCLDSRGYQAQISAKKSYSFYSNRRYNISPVVHVGNHGRNFYFSSGEYTNDFINAETAANYVGQYVLYNSTSSSSIVYIESIESFTDTSVQANVLSYETYPYFSIGQSRYADNRASLGSNGYMYNVDHLYPGVMVEKGYSTKSLYNFLYPSDGYIFGDSISYDEDTQQYTLENTMTYSSSENTLEDVIGKYLIKTDNSTGKETSGPTAYYLMFIAFNTNYYTNYAYYVSITNGQTLNDVDYNIYYSDAYTQVSDDEIHLENAQTINYLSYFEHYEVLNNQYVCVGSDTCAGPMYVALTYPHSYKYMKDGFTKVSHGFTYDETTGLYTLDEATSAIVHDAAFPEEMNAGNRHYSCGGLASSCEKIRYHYEANYNYQNTNYRADYILLSDGESVDDAVYKMLYADDVNQDNQDIKNKIDTWFERNLTDYQDFIDEAIFCDDRRPQSKGGWDPDSDSFEEYVFMAYNKNDLSCPSVTDQFSISNPKAKLQYPIALATPEEFTITNMSNVLAVHDFYENVHRYYNLLSFALYFSYQGYVYSSVYDDLILTGNASTGTQANHIRPVIVLKKGTEFISGDGSRANPYIVNTDN